MEEFLKSFLEPHPVDPLKEVPVIWNKKDLEQYLQPLYIIETYLRSKKSYEDFQTRMRNLMRGAIRQEETFTYPIRFKFYKDDDEEITLPFRQFLYNVYIWYPFYELDGIKILDKSFILQVEQIPSVDSFIYFKIAKTLEKYNVKSSTINHCMADVVYSLASISLDFSQIMGLNYSEDDFQEMYNDPEYFSIINAGIKDSDQPIEIEEKIGKVEKNLVAKLKSDIKNPLGIILRSGIGLKTKQLIEFFAIIGLRPSLTGEVIPHTIKNSLLVGGLDRPSYMYLDALGARKPLIANNKEMGNVGYFAKTLNIIVGTLKVSHRDLDCGTLFTVPYTVKTKSHLKLLSGKYFFDETLGDFRVVSKNDTKLIGRKINVRSAITCCCGENKVCPTCVGHTIDLNWDIVDGFTTFITEEWSKNVEQNILSTKHLLVTRSEKIEFTEEFYKYFSLDGEEITFLEDVNRIKDLAIYIDPEEIKKVEEFDPNSTYNTYIDSSRFFIVNRKTGNKREVRIKNDKEIFICTGMDEILKKNGNHIPFKAIEEDTAIFEVSILNNELVKPFYDLIKLLKSETKKDMDEVTIENMSQRFLDIFVEGKIDVSIVAGEIILNRLCRQPDNVRRRPNFSGIHFPKYKFYGLHKVIEQNGSPTLGMIFEQLYRQFTKMDFVTRTDTSFIDTFFQEWVSMAPFMKARSQLEKMRKDVKKHLD